MVKLVCAIVGVAVNAFPVDIDAGQLVGDLKKMIKVENPATITCDAKDLQLFLAKTEGDAWLDGAGAAAVALDERGHPQGCVQMDPTMWIKNPELFGDNFQPGEGQVHVLVVVPGYVRVGIGGIASRELKCKRCKRWFINAQCFVPVILAVITIIVLAFGENPTDEKGCLTVPGRSLIVCQMIGVNIVVGVILYYSQYWKSKLDNMIEEAMDETPIQAHRQEMTYLSFSAEAQHQELTEHTALLPATEAQQKPQQQQSWRSTKRNRRGR